MAPRRKERKPDTQIAWQQLTLSGVGALAQRVRGPEEGAAVGATGGDATRKTKSGRPALAKGGRKVCCSACTPLRPGAQRSADYAQVLTHLR